ncbi:MAG TPA: hypothetical protein VGB42_10185, partial [Candidatus Thermoplasmatota archaeon]
MSSLPRTSGFVLLLLLACLPAARGAAAQETARPARIQAQPASLDLVLGQSTRLTIEVLDGAGKALDMAVRVGGPWRALRVEPEEGGWSVAAAEVGEHELVVSTAPAAGERPLILSVPVRVRWPAVARVDVTAEGTGRLYQGTRLPHRARVLHADGSERPNPRVAWRTSDPAVATVDAFGNVRAATAGTVRVVASFEGVEGALEHGVAPLSVARLELVGGEEQVRTGDVQRFRAVARDASGRELEDVPVTWSVLYQPDDSIQAPPAPARVEDGRFVADVPGVHTVVASVGPIQAERSFRVVKRDVVREVEVVGQGREARVFTTDFWVFEGVDGRDYAFTGSKLTDGTAFVWDVTDPSNIVKTDSVVVDARSVNDIKVSPDGRWAALSREGASNRRNGVVILDLADPAHPKVASNYDEGLTGGVHNMFATETHLFALSNGDKYLILDVTDPYAPRYVSEYDHPDSRVHDVWVHDGIAYSAEWETGVVVVDVGNGRWGGSLERPVFVTAFPLPSGATHAVFPYFQESTGRFYLVVGDEIVSRRGWPWQGTGPDHRLPYDPATGKGGYPRATSGYIQIVDFTDPESPRMVAR